MNLIELHAPGNGLLGKVLTILSHLKVAYYSFEG